MAVQIKKIDGLSTADVDNLRQKNIKTVADLWARVGVDFDAGIHEVALETDVKEDVIIAILIAESLKQTRIKYSRFSSFRNEHPQAYKSIRSLLVIVITLPVLGYLLYRLPSMIDFPTQIVVTNAQGIPAYRVITPDDVALRTVFFRSSRAISDPQTVIGSFALKKLDRNARIRADQILPVAESKQLNNLYIVAVPVKASSLALTPKAGSKIALLLTPDENNKAPVTSVIHAVFLGVEQREGGPAVVVAVTNVEQMNGLLGGAAIVGLVPTPEVSK